MLLGALRTLAARDAPLLVPAFFWKLLAAEGFQPVLDECVRVRPPGRWWPSTSTRAARCAGPAGRGSAVGPDALDLLRRILGGDLVERAGRAGRRRPPTRSSSSPPGPSSTTSSAACAPSLVLLDH